MKIFHIVAVSKNNVIGNKGSIPWKNSHDMKRFKELTLNHAVLMGRKTWESLPKKYRPLLNRYNAILSRTKKESGSPDYDFYTDIDASIQACKGKGYSELYVIGGEEIYRQTKEIVDEIRMTVIEELHEGDAFYPQIKEMGLPPGNTFRCSYIEDYDGYHFKDYTKDVPF